MSIPSDQISLDAEEIAISAAPIHTHAEVLARETRHGRADFTYFRSTRFLGTFAGIVCCVMAVSGSFSVVTSVLSILNADLGPSPNYANITIVWTAVGGVSFLLIGRLSDIFGRRYFMIVSMLLGLIGCIIAGQAKNINTLIVSSAFTGASSPGAAGFQIFLAELVPVKHRGYWSALVLILVCPFQQWAPIVARTISINLSWRWIYHISGMFYGASAVLLGFFYFPPNFDTLHQRHSKRELLETFDYVGAILFTAGLLLFCLGISWGGNFFAWKSAGTLAPLTIGVVLSVAFFVWEAKAKLATPLISWPFITHEPRRFLFPFLCSSIGGMFYFGIFLIWPIAVNAVYTSETIIHQGWLITAVYVCAFFGACCGGIVFQAGGAHRAKLIGLNVIMVAFVIGASQTKREQSIPNIVCVCFMAWSIGALETLCQLWIASSRSVDNIGLSLGLLGSSRSYAGAIASAIYIAVLTNKVATFLPTYVGTAALTNGLPQTSLPPLFAWIGSGGTLPFSSVPGLTPAIAGAVGIASSDAYVDALRFVYYVVLAFGILGLVFAILSAKDMNHEMTNHIGKKLYNDKSALDEKTAETHTPSNEKADAVYESREEVV